MTLTDELAQVAVKHLEVLEGQLEQARSGVLANEAMRDAQIAIKAHAEAALLAEQARLRAECAWEASELLRAECMRREMEARYPTKVAGELAAGQPVEPPTNSE